MFCSWINYGNFFLLILQLEVWKTRLL